MPRTRLSSNEDIFESKIECLCFPALDEFDVSALLNSCEVVLKKLFWRAFSRRNEEVYLKNSKNNETHCQ